MIRRNVSKAKGQTDAKPTGMLNTVCLATTSAPNKCNRCIMKPAVARIMSCHVMYSAVVAQLRDVQRILIEKN
jgi:hypothetical protein